MHDQGQPPQRELLTVNEVAAMLGVGRSSLYQLLNKGIIPSFLVPGTRCRRMRSKDIREWIDNISVQRRPNF